MSPSILHQDCLLHVVRARRPHTGDVQHDRCVASASEMRFWRLGIKAAGGERFQCARLEGRAETEIPGAGNDGGDSIIRMRMRLDRGVRGDGELNRVEAAFGGMPLEHASLNA